MCISRVVRYHKIFFKVKTGKTKRYDEQKQFLRDLHSGLRHSDETKIKIGTASKKENLSSQKLTLMSLISN